MAQGRQLKWLHRLGYLTTALVALQLAALGSLFVVAAWREHEHRRAWREETAYHEGDTQQPDYVLPLLRFLPRAASLAPDGLRFVAYPALEQRAYALVLRRVPGGCTAQGLLLVIDTKPGRPRVAERHGFTLPGVSYRRLVAVIDQRLDGFAGSSHGGGTDGTDLVVERVRGDRRSAGGGNFVEPYRTLGELVLATVRPALPAVPLPRAGDDWYQPG